MGPLRACTPWPLLVKNAARVIECKAAVLQCVPSCGGSQATKTWPREANQGNIFTGFNLVWEKQTFRHCLFASARHTTPMQYPEGSKAYLAPDSLEMTHLPETRTGLERSAGVRTLLRLVLKGICSSWRGCPCCTTFRGGGCPRLSQDLPANFLLSSRAIVASASLLKSVCWLLQSG